MRIPTDLEKIIHELQTYIEKEGYRGYDPYDAMNSPLPFHLLGKYGQSLMIQSLKRMPVNLRPWLGIRKALNPKALGLFLEAYSVLYSRTGSENDRRAADHLFLRLMEMKSQGHNSLCWGYNFTWSNPQRILRSYHPSVVVTAFVGKGIYEYYRATRSLEARNALVNITRFILNDLPVTITEKGLCFSYTDILKDCCYNASLLGAEVLAKTYSLTQDDELRKKALRAADFVVAHQHPDGRWNYSIRLDSQKERGQVDFHQGFILTSLWEIIRILNVKEGPYLSAIERGGRFYKTRQFDERGCSKWRYPKRYPIDIHHQAQGIITFTALRSVDSSYYVFAERILNWTIRNMRSRQGYFYYRKYPIFTNKISYMRWGQAWMFLGLVRLLAAREGS